MKHKSEGKLDTISGCSAFPHNSWGVYEHLIYIKVKIVFLIQCNNKYIKINCESSQFACFTKGVELPQAYLSL